MNSYKFISGVIIGAAAGVALAIFLQSERGKEIISDVKNAANDATESLKARIQDFNSELSDLMQRGKRFIDDLENKAKDSTTTT